ncbi:hypothetical protein [Pseudoxanthomonas daejeonensis]|jgi:hypothetical protein|nr:hypothetical protein [Pseudoxanthomonas daejeonensis]
MDLSELELPDPCLPACPLLQESWQAAGLSTDTPEARSADDPWHD